jgi:methylmalonyl-CoA/ethylmalonyl-CoA epimerase
MPAELSSRPVFGRIDHIGVAVSSIEDSIGLYRDSFEMAEQHRETVEEQGVKAVLLEVGEGHVELIEPLSPDSGVAKFIERNGEGMHHVAYQTDDIDAALDKVRAAGLRLIDEQPRIGIRGSRVAFLHPKATGGVLTELVEPAH